MRKKILLMCTLLLFVGAGLYAQAIQGGAGVIHVDSDPNTIVTLNTMSITEGHVAYDTTTQIVYFYDQNGTVGVDRWIAVDIANLTSPIQSVTAAAGHSELTVVTDASGNVTIALESGAGITFNNTNNTLTYTDIDGQAGTPIDISGGTDLDAGIGTLVSGTGTAADPFEINLEGMAGAATGTVPFKTATGTLDWQLLVKSAEFLSTGELELTLSDDSKVKVNMENIPVVANATQLNTAATNVDAGTGGIARAAAANTFGLPANAGSGVLFFISN